MADKTIRKGNLEGIALHIVRELRAIEESTPAEHPAKTMIAEALAVAIAYHRAACDVDDLPHRQNVDLLTRTGTLRHYGAGQR